MNKYDRMTYVSYFARKCFLKAISNTPFATTYLQIKPDPKRYCSYLVYESSVGRENKLNVKEQKRRLVDFYVILIFNAIQKFIDCCMEVKIEDEKSVKNNYDAAMMRQLVLPTRESQTIMIEVVVKYYI